MLKDFTKEDGKNLNMSGEQKLLSMLYDYVEKLENECYGLDVLNEREKNLKIFNELYNKLERAK